MAKVAAKSVTITARIPAALAKKLEAFARATKRSRSWLVEDILDRYVDQEIAFVKFIQEGIDSADRGESVPHEEAVRQIQAHIARRKRERRKAA
jgi:predicted transcriptional regulator